MDDNRPIGPDKQLINRAFCIKPLLRTREGELHFMEVRDVYDALWDMDGVQSCGRAEESVTKLAEVDILLPATLNSGQLPGPTLAQVLPQVPKQYLKKTVAFEVRTTGDRKGDNGYVRGRLTLYSGELPAEMKAQPVRAWHKTYTEPFPAPEKPKKQFNAAAATTLKSDVAVKKPLALRKTLPPPRNDGSGQFEI
jgi:hypothetical protein